MNYFRFLKEQQEERKLKKEKRLKAQEERKLEKEKRLKEKNKVGKNIEKIFSFVAQFIIGFISCFYNFNNHLRYILIITCYLL